MKMTITVHRTQKRQTRIEKKKTELTHVFALERP